MILNGAVLLLNLAAIVGTAGALTRVAEHRYKAVVIDLFDTLVTWNPDSAAADAISRARDSQHDAAALPDAGNGAGRALRRDEILGGARVGLQRDIHRARKDDAVEITCLERFSRTLKMLGSR